MKSIYSLTVFSFFAVLIFASAAKAQAADGKSLDVLAGNTITGAWRINYAESDNPILRMQVFLQKRLAQPVNEKDTTAKDDALSTMSVSLVPPETLVLASDDNKSITINEAFSEIVFTRTFTTDGKTRSGEMPDGAIFFFMAMQSDDSLKVETVSPRGNKMSETYAVASGGKKLIVTVRFEIAQAKEPLTLRRVYDRTIPDVFSDGVEQIQ